MVLAIHPVDTLQLCTLCQEHWPCRQQQSRTSASPGPQLPPKTLVCLSVRHPVSPFHTYRSRRHRYYSMQDPSSSPTNTESSVNPDLPGEQWRQRSQEPQSKGTGSQRSAAQAGSTLGQRTMDSHRHRLSIVTPGATQDLHGFAVGLRRRPSASDPLPPFKLLCPASSSNAHPSLLKKGNNRIHTDGI